MLRRLVSTLALAVLTASGACARAADGAPASRDALTTTSAPTTTTAAPTTTTSALPPTTAARPSTLRPPPAPADPAALVRQLVDAETTLRDPAAPEAAVASAALAQQVAYRQLGVHPEWDAEVLAAVPPELAGAVASNAAARREFRAMHTVPPTTVPAWRIVEPDPIEELMAAYRDAEAASGVPWRYLAAIHLVETAMGRIRGTSTAGAQGPMQFMPATWAAYGAGGDIDDTHDAVMGAARYLAANNGAADIDQALYRYNHSEHYVRGVHLYADLLAEHPGALRAYYHWGVWYLTDHGDVYLPTGYEEPTPVPVADYLARG